MSIKINTFNKFSSFKLVNKTKPKSINNISNKLITGICIKDEDDFKIKINSSDVKSIIPNIKDKEIILDFTEDSYNLKGVVNVFSRHPKEKEKYVRITKDITLCKFLYGDKKDYVPFWHNWICNGYIVKCENKYMFRFKDCINPLIISK